MQLWLRADKGVTLVSGKVTQWADQSGNGRDATQSFAGSRPLLEPKSFGSKPGVAFDGVDTSLILPPLDLGSSQGLTLYLVVRRNTNANCEPFFSAQNAAEVDDVQLGSYRNVVNYEVNDQQVNDVSYPLSFGVAHIVGAVQSSGGGSHVTIDGRPAGDAQLLLPKSVQRKYVFLGHALYPDCMALDGALGEVLLYDRGLSDPEAAQALQYLQERWSCCGG